MSQIFSPAVSKSCLRIITLNIYCCRSIHDKGKNGRKLPSIPSAVKYLMPRVPGYISARHSKQSEFYRFIQIFKNHITWPNTKLGVYWALYRIKERYDSTNDIKDPDLLAKVANWRMNDKDQGEKYCLNDMGEKDYQVFVLEKVMDFSKLTQTVNKNSERPRYYSPSDLIVDKI